MNVRFLAAKTLAPVIRQQASLSSLFDNTIEDVPVKDRGLFQEMCYGTLRHFFELDHIAKQLLSKPLKEKDADVYAAILIGLYQLRHMRTPDHAAISECVNAVKKLKKMWATKLVNAILRNYLREQPRFVTLKSASAQYAHPNWLIKAIKDAWPDNWQTLLNSNNVEAPLTFRVNQQKTNRDDYLAQNSQYQTEACEYSPTGFRLIDSELKDVTQLEGFKHGVISVQDEAAQLSAFLLDLQANQTVLDACCAPGGKTSHILETETTTKLIAVELEANRAKRVQENLNRIGLHAEIKISDVLDIDNWWDGQQFDRILLDAPCSATGVIRRHPDIKLLRRKEDIANLSRLQSQLLDKMWQLLKPGGILVYATCSVLPQENTQTVEQFLTSNDDARELPFDAPWGIEQPVGRQLFPQVGGHDGFYYARIRKNS